MEKCYTDRSNGGLCGGFLSTTLHIPNLESIKLIVTKLFSGQDIK
jgi:hypothetical protein